MDALTVFHTYVGIKNHFNKVSFDFFKHHAKNLSISALNKRADKAYFERIAEKYPKDTPRQLILANVLHDSSIWPQAIASQEGKNCYIDWQKRTGAIYHRFECDMDQLLPSFDENVRLDSPGTHPYLLKQLIRKTISLETVALIAELTKAIPYWEGKMGNDIIWEMYRLKLMKYPPFLLGVDRARLRGIIREKFQDGERLRDKDSGG
jgi:hypothetical protein